MYVECLLGHVLVTVTSSLVRLWCDLLVEYRIEYLCITFGCALNRNTNLFAIRVKYVQEKAFGAVQNGRYSEFGGRPLFGRR